MPRHSSTPTVAVLATLLLGAAACTTWQRIGDTPGASPDQSLLQIFNPGPLYTGMGRLVSSEGVPFIATAATVPGPGDSARVLLGISLSNRAFVFERAGESHVARYRVEYDLTRAGAAPTRIARDGEVRVPSIQETLRNDETILLQQEVLLPPGSYELAIRIADRNATNVGRVQRTITVPNYTPGTISAPMLVYDVVGRGSPSDSLGVVINTRGSIAYGGDTLLVYVEGYRFNTPTSVPVEVRDETDSLVYQTRLEFTGSSPIESRIIRLTPTEAPLGRLEVIVGSGPRMQKVAALVSFSGNWVVTNFDDLLTLLRFFGEDNRVDQMRDAPADRRLELWREFFRITDPNRQTPENEALDAYFARISIANQRFTGEGISGWRTDRGEVFVTFGPPDESIDATPRQQGRFVQWIYNELRLSLVFQDPSGFGRFRMLPESRADFERVRNRLIRPVQ